MLRREPGFGLVELMWSMAIAAAVMGGVLAVVRPLQETFDAQAEIVDLRQRGRVGVETLHGEAGMAGSGLSGVVPAILPHALDGTFALDAATFLYAPPVAPGTTTRTVLASGGGEVALNLDPGCPESDPSCGFRPGMDALILDATGAFGVLQIDAVEGDLLRVRERLPVVSSYAAGSWITEARIRGYAWNHSSRQLVRVGSPIGGRQAPVLDNVIGLEFRYFGDPDPPAPVDPARGPLTTYGPQPPPLGVALGDYWPPGTNCTIDVAGTPGEEDEDDRRAGAAAPGAHGERRRPRRPSRPPGA